MSGLLANIVGAWLDGFAWPWLLLALPLPWLARRVLPARRRSGPALRVPFGDRLAGLGSAATGSARNARTWLAWAAWLLLCLAAARPQQVGEAVVPPQSGREMMVALDLSGSMSEPDMILGGRRVDRLTAAKAVLSDFLDRREGDRVGLLVFGQRAYVLAPPTLDLATVRQQLGDSVVGLAGRETAIGDGIGLAVKRLVSGAEDRDTGEHVLILLTDGVNNAGMLEPLKAAELARDAGVRVYTVAFGGDGAMSVFGFQLPVPAGEDEVDEATLTRIAESTGGRFFRARDTAQLAGIYAEIDRLEPIRHPGEAVRPRIERYQWPLGAALGLGLLGFAAPRRRFL
ncbi:VWA domain-containing protein [Lysobacter sp. A03]|uniref:vWA domain-containing protein n=1 Tax=Lysobacter sp. A03 TaxID=1199154 RepID=UPI0005B749C3|nr:VWA domain-containing protein [Lysobacter sp. A03]KIQ97781.1 BatA-like protein [Lysobacter sp. A03]